MQLPPLFEVLIYESPASARAIRFTVRIPRIAPKNVFCDSVSTTSAMWLLPLFGSPVPSTQGPTLIIIATPDDPGTVQLDVGVIVVLVMPSSIKAVAAAVFMLAQTVLLQLPISRPAAIAAASAAVSNLPC